MPSKEVQEEIEIASAALDVINKGPTCVPDITQIGDLTIFPNPETWYNRFRETYCRTRKS